jgi:hypothetical protein
MSEILIPVPKTSLEKLLKPVNRLTDSCVLRCSDDCLYTLCSSTDNSVILYGTTNTPLAVDNLKLNIISIKKLLTGLDCLGDDGEFKIIKNENHIVCKSFDPSTNEESYFKYHLVDDNIIKESPVKISNISNLSFDIVFEISIAKMKQIISAYSFANDVNKIYFYTKDDFVFIEIDDKENQNTDNISLMVSNSFSGKALMDPIATKIEIFKLLSSSKSPIKVKICTNPKVLLFEIQEDENTQLKYIISALVK